LWIADCGLDGADLSTLVVPIRNPKSQIRN